MDDLMDALMVITLCAGWVLFSVTVLGSPLWLMLLCMGGGLLVGRLISG